MWRSESRVPKVGDTLSSRHVSSSDMKILCLRPKCIEDSVTLHRWFLKGLNIKDECTMVLLNVENHSPNYWCSHLRQRGLCTTETINPIHNLYSSGFAVYWENLEIG
jgi:hypothetical protein